MIMKTIQINKTGNPADVLSVETVESVPLKEGEVRVKVRAAPINPSNLLQIAGQYGTQLKIPSTPGSEGVGEIVEVAPDVATLEVGQHVLLAAGGTWREEIVAPAAAFVPVPSGNLEQMAMIAVNPVTAHLLLTQFADLQEGDWIIQSAANSSVGELVIQLAALRGIKTVNIVRRDGMEASLTALGADVVLVDGEDLSRRVTEATNQADIRLAIDSVGGETFSRLVAALAPSASIVSYGALSGKLPSLNLPDVIFRDIQVKGLWVERWYKTATQADIQAVFGALIPLVMSGQLKTKIAAKYPLEQIAEAVTKAAESGRDGKVLLVPHHQ
jgi:NADPH:quinone reductase-like Zn-dependent oxidoreductase